MDVEGPKTVLVLCTGNSCRSQIAQGYLEHFASEKAKVFSAGIEAHGVNPLAVKVMAEDGVDISHQTSNKIDKYADLNFDYVITVCDNAKENCPYFPAMVKMFHQNFPDPAKAKGTETEVLDEFRKVRNSIKDYCRKFTDELL